MPVYNGLLRQLRYTLVAMNRNCSPQKEILVAIGVSALAVSRELLRNGMTRQNHCYIPAASRMASSSSQRVYWAAAFALAASSFATISGISVKRAAWNSGS
jgi:hypothetical protein